MGRRRRQRKQEKRGTPRISRVTPPSVGQTSEWRLLTPGAVSAVLALLALSLTAYQEYRYRDDKAQQRAAELCELQLKAFTLGRRISVYESGQAQTDYMHAIDEDAAAPSRYFEEDNRLIRWSFEEVSTAAQDLGVALQYIEKGIEPRTLLERKVLGQLQDRYPEKVVVAYRLGRHLGHFDVRAGDSVHVLPGGRLRHRR